MSGVLSAGLFLAPVPGLLALLAPAPLLITSRRRGFAEGARGALVGAVAATVFAGLLSQTGVAGGAASAFGSGQAVLAYVVLAVLPALLLDRALHWTRRARVALEVASVSYLLFIALLGVAMGAGTGRGTGEMVTSWVAESLDALAESYETQAGTRPEAVLQLERLERSRPGLQVWAPRLFPALLASLAIVAFWLNVVYTRWFTGVEGEGDDLTIWRMPMGAMYAFMGCAAVVVLQVGPIGDPLPRVEPLLGGAIGGLVLLAVLYSLQGVAVVNHWFFRVRTGPVMRMFGVLVQALVLMPPTTVVFAGVGLTDAWFDLRKLDEPEDVETGEKR